MIEASQFVESARNRGLSFFSGVPCSYFTPFINYTMSAPGLTYVSAVNEGDAVATAVGAVLGGQGAVAMMQNSGLGNAVNPLSSLAWVFRVPVLLIVTLRGDPDLQDEPQHELMGAITSKILDELQIPWEYFPTESVQVDRALDRACQAMSASRRPYAFIMRRESVASGAKAPDKWVADDRQTVDLSSNVSSVAELRARTDVLRHVIEATPGDDSVVIATTGFTGRELCALEDRSNQFYMVGSMGCASSLGLGISLVRKDLRVVVLDGDGALLMRMGNMATLGAYGQDNLIHLVLDNGLHESTGGQPTVSGGVSFANIARACGYGIVATGSDPVLLNMALEADGVSGPRFVHLKLREGTPKNLARPSLAPESVCERFMKHMSSIGVQPRERMV